MTFSRILVGALFVLAFIIPAAGANQPFYKGKVVNIVVPTAVGGSYDLYSRLVARAISKHVPGNPKVVVKNIPGHAGTKAANWLYKFAKKDGLTLGGIRRTLLLKRALGAPGARFEPAKFNWIGTPVQAITFCFVRSNGPYKSVDDLINASHAVTVATQPPSGSTIVPLLNNVIGAKLKLASGYTGIKKQVLAVDTSTPDVICRVGATSLTDFKKAPSPTNPFQILLQVGGKKHPDLPNVPLASAYALADKKVILDIYSKQLSVGTPWVMPPGTPAERVEIMRQAFTDLMTDPEFLKEAEMQKVGINPLPGTELQALVGQLVEIPADQKRALKNLLNIKGATP